MTCDFCTNEAENIGSHQCVVYCHNCAEKGEEAERDFFNTLEESRNKDKLGRHACPDWDYLVIEPGYAEYDDCCTCDKTKTIDEQIAEFEAKIENKNS